MKNFFLIFILVICTVLIGKNYFHAGLPYTHDGENHLARFANYKIAFKEKQFPPRFAPNLMNHYGYPVLNYNYPLANIISLPFSFLKINYELTFKIISFFGILFGAYGSYYYVLSVGFTRKSAIFSTIFWLCSPYLLSLVNFRGNIGEILAFSLLPWTLWSIERAKSTHYFFSYYFFFSVVILTAFLLSHNITAVFAIPIFLVLLVLRYQKNMIWYKNWIVTFGLSIGISLWFWLPALAEMNQIIIGDSAANQDFGSHFPTFLQLLFSPIQFGFSKVGTIDSLSFQIGFFVVIAFVFLLVSLLKSLLSKEKITIPPIALYSFCFIVLLVFFQLSISQSIWNLFSSLKFIQFPWRLTVFITALSLPVLAYVIEEFFLHHKKILIIIILLEFSFLLTLKPVDYFHKTNVDYDAYTGSTSTQNENSPKTFEFSEVGEWKPGPQIASESGKVIQISKWTGSEHEYSVNLTDSTIITEQTAYFLGWETDVKKTGGSKKTVAYDFSPQNHGLIAFSLEPGLYEITSRFTQNTPARVIGNVVSLVSAAGVIGYFTYLKNKRKI